MSYSFDANLLLYASDESSEFHVRAKAFVIGRREDSDILCLTWPVLMAYQRIATHPSIFAKPMSAETAWGNVQQLLKLPRARVIKKRLHSLWTTRRCPSRLEFTVIWCPMRTSLRSSGNMVCEGFIRPIPISKNSVFSRL